MNYVMCKTSMLKRYVYLLNIGHAWRSHIMYILLSCLQHPLSCFFCASCCSLMHETCHFSTTFVILLLPIWILIWLVIPIDDFLNIEFSPQSFKFSYFGSANVSSSASSSDAAISTAKYPLGCTVESLSSMVGAKGLT